MTDEKVREQAIEQIAEWLYHTMWPSVGINAVPEWEKTSPTVKEEWRRLAERSLTLKGPDGKSLLVVRHPDQWVDTDSTPKTEYERGFMQGQKALLSKGWGRVIAP